MLDTNDIEHANRISELDGLLVASLAPDLGVEGLEQFAHAVLHRLAAAPLRDVVLDCSAVLLMDGHEFVKLAQLGDMCRLLGARAYVVAMHPAIAIHLALTLAESPALRFCRDLDHVRTLVQAPSP